MKHLLFDWSYLELRREQATRMNDDQFYLPIVLFTVYFCLCDWWKINVDQIRVDSIDKKFVQPPAAQRRELFVPKLWCFLSFKCI